METNSFICGKTVIRHVTPAPLNITFNHHDGTTSRFTVDKDKLSFEGNADAAALQFIELLTRRNAEQWIALERRVLAAEEELAQYSHHNALMHLSHRLTAAHRELELLRVELALILGKHHSEHMIHCSKHCTHCKQETAQTLECVVNSHLPPPATTEQGGQA